MITTSYEKGMIFLCTDKCTSTTGKHNYLILGTMSDSQISFVQTMSITSMIGKTIKMEVPIKLCNDYISYVVPYNIHSLEESDIRITEYKGIITDTERISKNDFLQLLMDIYMDSLGMNPENHDSVIQRYNEYCDNFWKEFNNVQEFRHYKEKENRFIINLIEDDDEIKTEKFKKKKMKEKNKKREKRYIDKMMREATYGNIEEQVDSLNEESPDILLEDMVRFGSAHIHIMKWSDQELIDFIIGYNKYGFTQIHTVLPNRWVTQNSMMTCYNRCVNEAKHRNIHIDNVF